MPTLTLDQAKVIFTHPTNHDSQGTVTAAIFSENFDNLLKAHKLWTEYLI
jgi:hypothetical protein